MHDHLHIYPFRVIILFLSALIIATPTIYFLFSPSSHLGRSYLSILSGARMVRVKHEGLALASKKTVAIIGAGVSGLQAARTILQSQEAEKFNVVIFEARDRIGGRVWTNHPWKFPLDFGTLPFLSLVNLCRGKFYSRNRWQPVI